MAAELRWILAGLGVLLIAGILWWGVRRSRQAPGHAELRETTAAAPAPARPAGSGRATELEHAIEREHAIEPEHAIEEAGTDQADLRPHDSAARDWGIPPFEPLTIRTAEFEELPPMDPPMTSRAEPLQGEMHGEPAVAAQEPPAPPPRPPAAQPPPPLPAPSPPPPARSPSPQSPQDAEPQHIVSIRVCAPADAEWAGVDLLAALESHGLAHGRYNVFHRKHSDGRTQFFAASLVEPGTFSLASMPHEEFRGLTLYAVLPGPVEPLQTLDALIATAGALAQTLDGSLLDSAGLPLTMQRAAALREDVARFQARLAMIAPSDPQ